MVVVLCFLCTRTSHTCRRMLTELDNDSESVWVKLFVNKKTHFVASWYRPPVDGHLPVSDNGNDLLNSLEKFDNLFREQLDKIKNINKGNNPPPPPPPLIHVLGDFNFRDIVWPDRLSKSGSSLSQTEGQILIDIMNDHGFEQLVNFPTRERNTLDLILTSLPGQFADIQFPHTTCAWSEILNHNKVLFSCPCS